MNFIKDILKLFGVVAGVVVLAAIFLFIGAYLDVGEKGGTILVISYFATIFAAFAIYKIKFVKNWKGELKQFIKEANKPLSKERLKEIEENEKIRKQKDKDRNEEFKRKSEQWNKEKEERDKREREEKAEQEREELTIAAVTPRNGCVDVYNIKGRRMFSIDGELEGYTSSTVSVSSGNSILVYDSKRTCIMTRSK